MANANVNLPASAAQRGQPGVSPTPAAKKEAIKVSPARPSPTNVIKLEMEANKAAINGLQTGFSNLSTQLSGLMNLIQLQTQQQAVQSIPAPVGRPVQQQPVQNRPQPVQMQQQVQQVSMGGPIIDRSEAGQQSRAENCACCGQRRRDGTVALDTGEYIASGMTTAWLKLQPTVLVNLADDGFRSTYQVSGQWLADTLSKRARDERATSVPGFLSGERSSQHPTVRLVSALVRRATKDEEATQYATRVLSAAANLQSEGYSL
jgi:hypothetical protein